MKKLINSVDDFVKESLEGMQVAHGSSLASTTTRSWCTGRTRRCRARSGVISGGGSGHEPMHGGFVGKGMLDAACPGEVFTSPTPDQMEWATKKVDGGAGVLHIVKNYSGDVMNFEMAADLGRDAGVEVESVVVDDDVAAKDSLYTQGGAGRRDRADGEDRRGQGRGGADLASVAELARDVNANVRSMGLALTSCTVPAAGQPTFELGDDEVEIGIGIHGEPGRERIKMESADQLTDRLTRPVIEDLKLNSGDQVLVFVNSMGGTPLAELYVIYRRVVQLLEEGGVVVARNLVGPYITSLEMQGASVTILRLDDEKTRLWDAPVHTPALLGGVAGVLGGPGRGLGPENRGRDRAARGQPDQARLAIGDGDHGTNMNRGRRPAPRQPRGRPGLPGHVQGHRDGPDRQGRRGLGPLYGSLFGMGKELGDATEVEDERLAAALRAGYDSVVARGKAQLEDKTMLDAWHPALDALDAALAEGARAGPALDEAAAAAAARKATIPMIARKGRASYLGERSRGHQDPGATSTQLILKTLADVVNGRRWINKPQSGSFRTHAAKLEGAWCGSSPDLLVGRLVDWGSTRSSDCRPTAPTGWWRRSARRPGSGWCWSITRRRPRSWPPDTPRRPGGSGSAWPPPPGRCGCWAACTTPSSTTSRSWPSPRARRSGCSAPASSRSWPWRRPSTTSPTTTSGSTCPCRSRPWSTSGSATPWLGGPSPTSPSLPA